MTLEQKNIVFIGASSAAMGAATHWVENHLDSHRLILIEEKTHYNHVFAFPRAAVMSGFEEELFVPYDNMFLGDSRIGQVVHARAIAIHKNHVELDREIPGFGNQISFEYLVYTAGATIPTPGRFKDITREACIERLREYQRVIAKAQSPIIIGAGAVGIELASEIKEYYPKKHVTLIHSRARYLPRYKASLDTITYNILQKKGVKQIMGDRVILPPEGFPLEVKPIQVHTKNGKVIHGDLAIMCIGMTPNSKLLEQFIPEAINPVNGFVKVKPTMQIDVDGWPNIFVAGDVADHTDVKIGHYAWMQGLAALTNIKHMISGEPVEPYKSPLVVLGSWIAARSIPENVYATFSWNILKADPEKITSSSTTVEKQ
ncbi:uncharacterized protein BX663DRAFT_481534 [Cokeromyces recurvatus]|uniref:uncharacterized protein n=1 Tax=Cokeromyces recurvatus TaxID=90255 RepID=UPI002220B6B0|nr:uncharacterized protein BX663DRAFT_481534 [Cokeromyces recurvatus]KAI7897542.1 hypothetical protein BX663DRAFT_481534 [Cokeromyces recurvatus]